MTGRLAGKIAVVTGGASGIGEATCRLFAREGALVVVADLNRAAGERLVAELRAGGAVADFFATDVSADASVGALVDGVMARHGRLDVLFNNAGIGSWTDRGEAGWWRVVDVNLTGVFLGLRHGVRAMRRVGGGAIISTASHAGLRGVQAGVYGATKAAVMTLTRWAALTYAPERIRVNSILPGNIYTPIHDLRRHDAVNRYLDGDRASFAVDPIEGQPPPEGREETIERFRQIHPLGRLATVDDIAHGALYLASDEAGQVTGIDLPVTGGILPPLFRDRVLAARAAAGDAPPDPPADGAILLATGNDVLASALADRFAAAGLRIERLADPTETDPDRVRARLVAVGPLAGVVFGLRPDRSGDGPEPSPVAWREELAANLRAPWVLVEAAADVLPPGGAITIVADAAGLTGAGASPGFCAAASGLIYLSETMAAAARPRGVRVNCLIPERSSDLRSAEAVGGPASAADVAEVVFTLARGVRGLTGLQLSLETAHPGD
ncbi:MAG TPA: SDR family oxidoreductase [Chloroflexota bacterium]